MKVVLYVDADGSIFGRLGSMPRLEPQHVAHDLEWGRRYVELEVTEEESGLIDRLWVRVVGDGLELLPEDERPSAPEAQHEETN